MLQTHISRIFPIHWVCAFHGKRNCKFNFGGLTRPICTWILHDRIRWNRLVFPRKCSFPVNRHVFQRARFHQARGL